MRRRAARRPHPSPAPDPRSHAPRMAFLGRCVALLLEAAADPLARDREGKSALELVEAGEAGERGQSALGPSAPLAECARMLRCALRPQCTIPLDGAFERL